MNTIDEQFQTRQFYFMIPLYLCIPMIFIWGIIARIFASGFHIGATLFIFALGYLTIPLMFIHSGMNVFAVYWSKKSLIQPELVIACIRSIVFACSFLVNNN